MCLRNDLVQVPAALERAPTAHPLTVRELQVAELVAAGLAFREIGKRLGISECTAKATVARAGAKIPGDLPLRLRITHWYHGGERVTVRRAEA